MGILLMIVGVLGVFVANRFEEITAAAILIMLGLWAYGAFDSILGVCQC